MRALWERFAQPRVMVTTGCAISLGLGLVFLFVWAPHPWGWQGIDAYHALAPGLARGESFPTTDVPWGYAYFAAAFYVLFGEQVWIPLTVQVVVNAFVPVLLYAIVARLADRQTAALAALLIGVFSFNTVYASTQSSDAVCTVVFLAAIYLVIRAHASGRIATLLGSAILFGIAPQFRPNLVLFPAIVAALWTWRGQWRARALAQAAAFMVVTIAMQLPWIVRNYQLTGMFLPTSTHGGVQLWYGTLQTGPYLESRAHNPRSIFASAPFPYTSIERLPIVVTAQYVRCLERPGESVSLIYWTDRDSHARRVSMSSRNGDQIAFEIPGQSAPTVVYYYLESSWPAAGAEPAVSFAAPIGGRADPFVLFVSDDHFGDLDTHDELLDIFDVVRAVRHLAWGEAPPSMRVDLDRDGTFTDDDLTEALTQLLPEAKGNPRAGVLSITPESATLRLRDGSSLVVPRQFSRHTDLAATGEWAGDLASRRRTYTSFTETRLSQRCAVADSVAANGVFYRFEPHQMIRYTALAADNIRRDPVAFAAAAAYRAVRLFIIRGTDDVATTQQFAAGRLAYTAGMILSTAYFAVFAWGVVIAWRRRSPLLWLLVPIAYVPLTICFVLTNMRYTITVQPLMFAFVAMALREAVPPSREPAGLSTGD